MRFRLTPEDNLGQAFYSAAMDVVQSKFEQMGNILSDAVTAARDNLITAASATLSVANLKSYQHGLKINVTTGPDSIAWELYLDAEAQRIEGFGPFDMIAHGLVKHNKNVKFSEKTGRYYAKIPFERPGMYSKIAKLKADNVVQKLSATPTTRGNLAADLKVMKQRAEKILSPEAKGMKDGKTWSLTKDPIKPVWNFYDFAAKQKEDFQFDQQPSPLMSGITAVKKEGKTAYFTWRTATDARMPGKPMSWMHPGVSGNNIFTGILPDLIKDAQAEIDKKLAEIFSG